MKRMLSLVLSLILAWSLTIPSLAAEDLDPPLWQQMGFSSREECITYVYGDEDAYEQAVQEALERQQWEDAMADDIAAFDPDAYWESDECQYSWSYDSKEEFMEDWFLETEEEFRQSLDFVRACGLAKIHIFPYSRRTGTPAAKMSDQVPNVVKESRASEAAAVAAELEDAFHSALIGTVQEVLFEQPEDGLYAGHAPNYAKVYVRSDEALRSTPR